MHDAFYLNTEIFTENLEKGIQKQKNAICGSDVSFHRIYTTTNIRSYQITFWYAKRNIVAAAVTKKQKKNSKHTAVM